ncbi:MAG TPA: YmfQ family protein, partial [Firmicutes bacterium]|nr:YmfQ family protein [Bacillota bacterium]
MTQPYKPNLMRYLPPYYVTSPIMSAIQNAASEEFGAVQQFIDDLKLQFLTPTTATWGLGFWEQEIGLKTDISQSYEERREIIMARLKGMGTFGRDVLISAASAFSGGEVDVIEYPAESRVVVKFVGTLGIPKHMASFIKMVEEIRPAHLAY